MVAFDLFTPTNWQAHLISTEGRVLLAFPWYDNADRILLGPRSGEFLSTPTRKRGTPGRKGGGGG